MAAVSIVSQEILNPQLHIEGSASLNGVLRVSGAKNSALVLMTATLLCPEPVELCNVPDLTDIVGMAEILQSLGVRVQRDGDRMVLDASNLTSHEPPYELVNSLRAVSSASDPCWAVLVTPRFPCLVAAASEPAPSSSTSAG